MLGDVATKALDPRGLKELCVLMKMDQPAETAVRHLGAGPQAGLEPEEGSRNPACILSAMRLLLLASLLEKAQSKIVMTFEEVSDNGWYSTSGAVAVLSLIAVMALYKGCRQKPEDPSVRAVRTDDEENDWTLVGEPAMREGCKSSGRPDSAKESSSLASGDIGTRRASPGSSGDDVSEGLRRRSAPRDHGGGYRTWTMDQNTGVRDECAPFPSTGARDECAPFPSTGVRDECAPFPSTGVRDECAPFPSTGVRDECAPILDTGVRKVSAPEEDQGGALQPSTGVGNMRETGYRAQQAIPSLPYAGANHRTSWDHPFRVHPSWPPPKQPPISMRTPDPMWGGPAGHYHQVIPSHVKSDFWLHDRARGVVIRFHAKSRRFMFNPVEAKLPDGLTTEAMTGRRTLAMADTESQRVEDNWKSDATVDLQFVWVGRTEFELVES